jgi:alanine racemase
VRAARAEVDLDAIAHNVALLREVAAPAALCVVVKADGYGHGAVAVGEVALASGASHLAVALVEEGAVLRRAGIDAPILLLSEPRLADIGPAVGHGLELTLYSLEGIEAAAKAGAERGRPVPVHLKVNTGMNRVGAAPSAMVELARAVADNPPLHLEAVWTHCAVADEPDNPFTATQLDLLDATVAALADAGLRPRQVHAANSAATIDHPHSRRDLVRCGIAVYGLAPAPALADRLPLRPAMRLRAEVSMVKVVPAGDGVSYGLRHTFDVDTVVATVPLGYADGVPRSLSLVGGEVLVGGRRRPMVGVVTMDQFLVDLGPAGDAWAESVAVGDEVVLLGRQGAERIGAEDWAERLGTIAYEVVCGIGPRVPRTYP